MKRGMHTFLKGYVVTKVQLETRNTGSSAVLACRMTDTSYIASAEPKVGLSRMQNAETVRWTSKRPRGRWNLGEATRWETMIVVCCRRLPKARITIRAAIKRGLITSRSRAP